jgi:threonine synthase
MRAYVVIPDGYVAMGKLAQALLYGAEVLAIQGNFDDALRMVRQLADQYPIKLVNSVNPYRLEGQKTGAFEVVDALGDAPDWLCVPVGNAGNITAYWMGFCEYHQEQRCRRLPRMMGFQAAGSAPLIAGHPIADPNTVATAIRIGHPASWDRAIAVKEASQGAFNAVTDEEILVAYRLLAHEEGVFCEPASQLNQSFKLDKARRISTWTGFKGAKSYLTHPPWPGASGAPFSPSPGLCSARPGQLRLPSYFLRHRPDPRPTGRR